MRKVSIRNEQGQTLTEFALVLPLLLVLVFAVIQFGITFNNYLAVTDAVRAGARVAAVGRHLADPVASAVDRVREAAADLDQSQLAVSVSYEALEPGAAVAVSASYPYEIDLLGWVVASGDLSSTTTERVE